MQSSKTPESTLSRPHPSSPCSARPAGEGMTGEWVSPVLHGGYDGEHVRGSGEGVRGTPAMTSTPVMVSCLSEEKQPQVTPSTVLLRKDTSSSSTTNSPSVSLLSTSTISSSINPSTMSCSKPCHSERKGNNALPDTQSELSESSLPFLTAYDSSHLPNTSTFDLTNTSREELNRETSLRVPSDGHREEQVECVGKEGTPILATGSVEEHQVGKVKEGTLSDEVIQHKKSVAMNVQSEDASRDDKVKAGQRTGEEQRTGSGADEAQVSKSESVEKLHSTTDRDACLSRTQEHADPSSAALSSGSDFVDSAAPHTPRDESVPDDLKVVGAMNSVHQETTVEEERMKKGEEDNGKADDEGIRREMEQASDCAGEVVSSVIVESTELETLRKVMHSLLLCLYLIVLQSDTTTALS